MHLKQHTLPLLTALALTTSCKRTEPVTEPQLEFPPLSVMVNYRLDDVSAIRVFIDEAPLGSLDRVIVWRNKEKIILAKGDPEFKRHKKVYLQRIRPLYME